MSGTTQFYNDVADDAILHPTSRKLFNTWECIRGENPAPSRSAISMRDLAAILPWTCILQRDPQNMSYVYRLAGSAACKMTGRQLTGTTAFNDGSDTDRETIVRSLDTVVAKKRPCIAHFVAQSFSGRELSFEFAAVPVISADDTDVQVLATMAPFLDARGLSADPLVQFHVRMTRILWGNQLPGKPVSTAHCCNDDNRGIQTGFLRVIEGGKTDNPVRGS